jgi:hypothetical protein
VVYAVTESNRLIRFNAGQPQTVLSIKNIQGLEPGEQILGIDFRVARGVLYALGSSNRLYVLDPELGVAKRVSKEPFAVGLRGREFGFDFNPVADRIRLVSDAGQNLRLHPDTGAVVDSDPAAPGVQIDARLAYAPDDRHAGIRPVLVAAAYTYNKTNDQLTTNYALDAGLGVLLTQGSREGRMPAVSPNTGQLFTVGPLGTALDERSAFDIADVSNTGFVATGSARGPARFYSIDLHSGALSLIGSIGSGEAIRCIAVAPE